MIIDTKQLRSSFIPVRVSGEAIAERSGAVEMTTSSMLMEVKAITKVIMCLQAK